MEKHAILKDRLYYGQVSLLERIKWLTSQAADGAPKYFRSLLPSLEWLPKYNRRWLVGDLIAGLTVGLMVVPQSLAYAKLANLPVVYGLYASFMGTIVYSFTGTCREIAIGPAAVLLLLVGSVASKVGQGHGDVPVAHIAVAINLAGGVVTLVLGVLQLGILLDLIPNPVIMGFTTGSAFVIISTQAASLLGVPNVGSSGKTVEVMKAFVSNAPHLNCIALVFGLCSLLLILCLNCLCKQLGGRFRGLKIASSAVSVVLFTTIAFFLKDTGIKLKVVQDVPEGFGGAGIPPLVLSSTRISCLRFYQ
ncbi:Sulfate permease 2 [Entomophthora muscae]|uniref:Sulfate permease 2 n=1 Tax=Entomophthora muscae TaxID=34485 RepID=A0ACC2UDP8_9FUNG|nr:Sulfate permease 2 [Entomophthora muscae]